MSLFPRPDKKADAETDFDKLISKSDAAGAGEPARRMLELVKLGHAILKTMIQKDSDAYVEAQTELFEKIRSMGVTDQDDIVTLSTVITTLAIHISPGTYGEDYNAWVED